VRRFGRVLPRLGRDRLLISLAPGSVELVRVASGLQPRVLEKRALDCDPAPGPEPWRNAIAALAAAAEQLRGERVDVTVVLSNHFARYAVVKSDATRVDAEEALALARFHFGRIYGEAAKEWDIRSSESARGAPRLASAVDIGLVPAIRECFPPRGAARLVSVQPYLMSAFNRWRNTIAQQDSWMLLIEPQRACLALLAGGQWTEVQTLRGEYPAPEDWAVLLDRQRLRSAIEPAPNTVHVHAPADWKFVSGEVHGWKMVALALPPLTGILPREDARFAVALTAR